MESLTANYTAIGRVVDFNDIHGTGRSRYSDTKAEKESATHELGSFMRGSLDDCAYDDNQSTASHAHSSAKAVNDGTDKRQGNDTANLVHGRDNASPEAVVLDVICGAECSVLQQVVDERSIIAVHGRAEEADDGEDVNHDHGASPFLRWLLDESLVKGFIAVDDLFLERFLWFGRVRRRDWSDGVLCVHASWRAVLMLGAWEYVSLPMHFV